MKILHRSKKYDKKAVFRIKPAFILKAASLDDFLSYKTAHRIPNYGKFRAKLLSLLKTGKRNAKEMKILGKLISRSKNFKKDPELTMAALLKLAEKTKMAVISDPNKEVLMKCEDYYKSYFLQASIAKALMTVMPRKEALAYFRKFVEHRLLKWGHPPYKKVAEELTLHKAVKKGQLKDGAVFVEAITEDGKAVMKLTRCRPYEVLRKEIGDKDIIYEIICYPDYLWAKMANPNFVLTREKALSLGMPYCGHVWHDKRIHKNIKHPSREFWKKLK